MCDNVVVPNNSFHGSSLSINYQQEESCKSERSNITFNITDSNCSFLLITNIIIIALLILYYSRNILLFRFEILH